MLHEGSPLTYRFQLFEPAVYGLFATYLTTFLYSWYTDPPYQLAGVKVTSKVPVPVDENGSPEQRAVAIGGKDAGKVTEPTPSVNGGPVTDSKIAAKTESTYIRELPARIWDSLIFGIPSPRSLLTTLATLLINTIIVGMVYDRVHSEHKHTAEDLSFVRVGYVSDNNAKLLIREPDQEQMPLLIEVRMKDLEPPFDNPLWTTAGGIRWTKNDTDFTAVLDIPLRHATQRTYEWRSTNANRTVFRHHGEITAAPKPGATPVKHDGKFTFLSTSCIVSRLPYNPFDHPLTIKGMKHLADALPDLGASFMLFLGDFIYVDVPKLWGEEVEDYRQKYRQVYASPNWPSVGQNLSWIHVLDDHEIKNDWDKNSTGVYQAAIEPYHHYHTAANPPAAPQAGSLSARPKATWFEFAQGPASFFMLDTRSYRSDNKIAYTDPEKTMLGPDQLEDFLAFLKRPEHQGVKWKIIASSVPFTKNWPVNTQDTWGGFLVERQRILEAMWDCTALGYGVVILSGDRHEFAATKFPPPANSSWSENSTVYEFSASPLSQFYSPLPSYQSTFASWLTGHNTSDPSDVKIKYVSLP